MATNLATKELLRIQRPPEMHWVGDGFPVMTVASPQQTPELDPFLLFDYAMPREMSPTTEPRGVDSHPHRGFETVTLVWQGELEHRDSAGHSGKIGPGDVQWMTAASGVNHEEKHSASFSETGGTFEVAQLWVNLPSAIKMSPPKYQEILASSIPKYESEGVQARLIAGAIDDLRGAAVTFTPVILWDVQMDSGSNWIAPIASGNSAGIFVRSGSLELNGQTVQPHELAIFGNQGEGIQISSETGAEFLVIGGTPIGETVVQHGPFVMNTAEEINQAILDFRAGKFGEL